MTKAELIQRAELYLDDSSELSTQEFSDLFDKIYDFVCAYRPWEFTKKAHTATVGGTSTALPTDFLYLTNNSNASDNWTEASTPVVFVGTNYLPYKVVSWSDRRQYRDRAGYAYLDIPNNNLVFTTSIADSIEFDYHAKQPALLTNEEPAFPEQFHPALFHGMVVDELMIEGYEKARSYAPENQKKFDEYLARMAYWNSKLVNIQF
jgi:hypothetical protein